MLLCDCCWKKIDSVMNVTEIPTVTRENPYADPEIWCATCAAARAEAISEIRARYRFIMNLEIDEKLKELKAELRKGVCFHELDTGIEVFLHLVTDTDRAGQPEAASGFASEK